LRPDPQEERALTACAHCGGNIYVGDEVQRIDDSGGNGSREAYVHNGFRQDCAAEYAMERVYDRAGIIGSDYEIN